MPKIVVFNEFLNGVCRHEPPQIVLGQSIFFLNGVCRHERDKHVAELHFVFLNGVCRHERLSGEPLIST